jgi:hypothetical protein
MVTAQDFVVPPEVYTQAITQKIELFTQSVAQKFNDILANHGPWVGAGLIALLAIVVIMPLIPGLKPTRR